MSVMKVVHGTRGIESVVNRSPTEGELPRAIQAAKALMEAMPLREGEKLFVSNSRRYIIQLTAPTPRMDEGTGALISPRPEIAAFAKLGYLFRTKDQRVIALLEANALYGIDFFDAEERVAQEQTRIKNLLLAKYKAIASPKDVAELAAELSPLVPKAGQTEIPLPPKAPRVRVNGKFVKAPVEP